HLTLTHEQRDNQEDDPSPNTRSNTHMYAYIGTIDNFLILPSPVLDESAPGGSRIEQRLQVTIKAASNEQTQTVELRLGDESAAPGEEQLTKWLESGETGQSLCPCRSPPPFPPPDSKGH